MRKHLFGLAIFISIITAAVLVYGYFNAPPIPVIPAVDYPKDHLENLDSGLPSVAYRVSAAELDIKDRTFRARVDLEWDGKHAPPESLFMKFYLINANGERTTSVNEWVFRKNAFADGNRRGITISLYNVDMSFAQHENLYAFVEFSSDGKFSSLPDERTASAKRTSVLLLHDGQAVRSEPIRLQR
jgi:hypothetical protein